MKKAKGLFKRGLEMIDAWKLGEHKMLDIKEIRTNCNRLEVANKKYLPQKV